MTIKCPNPCEPCAEGLSPDALSTENFSSEAPDVDLFLARSYGGLQGAGLGPDLFAGGPDGPPLGSPWGSSHPFGFGTSPTSPEDAGTGALNNFNEDQIKKNWPIGPVGLTSQFSNNAQSCPEKCGGGPTNGAVVPKGNIHGASQFGVDTYAKNLACARTLCGNDFTQCFSGCWIGGPAFGFSVAKNTFFYPTRAQANAVARQWCHYLANVRKFCLDEISNLAGCLGEEYQGSVDVVSEGFEEQGEAGFSVFSGELPPGTELFQTGPFSATIFGTPTAVGKYKFSIEAVGHDGGGHIRPYTISIIDIATAEILPDALFETFYSVTLATGGPVIGPILWAVTAGELPKGLQLNPVTGTISGTPEDETPLSYGFTIGMMSVGLKTTCSKTFTLTVNNAGCAITSSSPLPNGMENTAYNEQLTQAGLGTPVWSLTGGALPPGVTLSAGGLLSGSPTTADTYGFTVQALEADHYCTKNFVLTVDVGPVCPAWNTITWAANSPLILGAGTYSASLVNNTWSIQANSPGGGPDAVTCDEFTPGPDGLIYNGPGCNGNLHVEYTGVGVPLAETRCEIRVEKVLPYQLLAIFPAGTANGIYNIPFVVPDTLGVDMHLFITVECRTGLDNFSFTPSSINVSGSVTTV